MRCRSGGEVGAALAGVAAALVLPAWGAAGSHGGPPPREAIVLERASRLRLEGTSTIHSWRGEASRISALVPDPTGAEGVRLVLRVPVERIRSGNRAMDRDLHRALRARANPWIEFRMREAWITGRDPSTGAYAMTAAGELSVAGTKRPLLLPIDVQVRDGTVHVRGSLETLMSEFGVEPPTAVFGLIRAHDEVMVRFDLVARAAEVAERLEETAGFLSLAASKPGARRGTAVGGGARAGPDPEATFPETGR